MKNSSIYHERYVCLLFGDVVFVVLAVGIVNGEHVIGIYSLLDILVVVFCFLCCVFDILCEHLQFWACILGWFIKKPSFEIYKYARQIYVHFDRKTNVREGVLLKYRSFIKFWRPPILQGRINGTELPQLGFGHNFWLVLCVWYFAIF